MTLVVFLMAYSIRRYLDGVDRLYGDSFWRHWFHSGGLGQAGREAAVLPGLLRVTFLAVSVAILAYLLERSGLTIAVYLLDFLLLQVLMGTPGWKQRLEGYSVAWQNGDMQGAWRLIQSRLPAGERGEALSPQTMHLFLSRQLVTEVFERFFLVAFWYVVGGIGLAVLARGLVALAVQWPQAAARPAFARLAGLASWVPARLLALTFGLAGDLAGWSRVARKIFPGYGKKTSEVLMISASGSLTGYALDPERFARIHPDSWANYGGRSLAAIRDLLSRSMLVWICLVALLVIAGAA